MSNQVVPVPSKTIMGHPAGLFVLFFTEMWERFSYYGMRALLTLYLTAELVNGGFGLSRQEGLELYAIFTGLVYLTPIIGGWVADNFFGQRKTIYIGGIVMAVGQILLAASAFMSSDLDVESRNFLFNFGLGVLIIGNGFFKPNISTLVGSLYEEGDIKRDGGFTIFYMGINLGAMIAPLFCGYLGEVYGWHYGFGAAGLGMLAGLIVFWKGISANVLGDKGLQPIEYIDKKISGISITNIIYTIGFLLVPIFAYLIILDREQGLNKWICLWFIVLN